MKLKNLPSWLKGGIITGSITLISYFILRIIFLIDSTNLSLPTIIRPFLFTLLILISLLFFTFPVIFLREIFSIDNKLLIVSTSGDGLSIVTTLGAILIILMWILFGMLMGWIIWRRKKK